MDQVVCSRDAAKALNTWEYYLYLLRSLLSPTRYATKIKTIHPRIYRKTKSDWEYSTSLRMLSEINLIRISNLIGNEYTKNKENEKFGSISIDRVIGWVTGTHTERRKEEKLSVQKSWPSMCGVTWLKKFNQLAFQNWRTELNENGYDCWSMVFASQIDHHWKIIKNRVNLNMYGSPTYSFVTNKMR